MYKTQGLYAYSSTPFGRNTFHFAVKNGAGNGEDLFNGEYLINAQGEDVVAGIRTPQQITKIGSQRWAERAGISDVYKRQPLARFIVL